MKLQLDGGPTRWLLDEVLPKVDIGAYARAMLCLPDSPT